VATCCGDGSVKIWDAVAPPNLNPIRHLAAHSKEVVSLDWNTNHTQLFLSSSWDDTIKLWSAQALEPIRSFERHTYCVYAVKWCVPSVPQDM
jgi:peroxin-7